MDKENKLASEKRKEEKGNKVESESKNDKRENRAEAEKRMEEGVKGIFFFFSWLLLI